MNQNTPMLLADNLFESLVLGRKSCTIRRGRRDVACGTLILKGVQSGIEFPVTVTDVNVKPLRDLTDAEAQLDDAPDAHTMQDALKSYYPDITLDDEITIIRFEPVVYSTEQILSFMRLHDRAMRSARNHRSCRDNAQ